MSTDNVLELTLDGAADDGIAYFTDDAGKKYFRPRDGKPIRPLIQGKDDHPMMYQYSGRHPLAEIGRKFRSIQDADHYVRALVNFDHIIRHAIIAGDVNNSDGLREKAATYIVEKQEKIKTEDLGVLETIPGFDEVREYLDMTPEQIYSALETRSVSM